MRRSSDPTSCHVDFTPVFDSELQTSPSLRVIYLYLLYLAKDAPKLEPRLRPSTASGQKWVSVRKGRHKTTNSSTDSDWEHSDVDSEGDVGSDVHTDRDQAAAKGVGPAAHTRNKHPSASTRKRSRQARRSKQQAMQAPARHQHADRRQAQLRHLLARLPIVARCNIACGNAIRFGNDCVVSKFCLRD